MASPDYAAAVRSHKGQERSNGAWRPLARFGSLRRLYPAFSVAVVSPGLGRTNEALDWLDNVRLKPDTTYEQLHSDG